MDEDTLRSCYGRPIAVFNRGNSCFVFRNHKVKGPSYILYEKDQFNNWYLGKLLNSEAIEVLQSLPHPSTSSQFQGEITMSEETVDELKTDDDGNVIVTEAMPREQLNEIALLVGVEPDDKLSDEEFVKVLLESDGTVGPTAEVEVSTEEKTDPNLKATITSKVAQDVLEYLAKVGKPVAMPELNKNCGVLVDDMKDIIKNNPDKIVTMKRGNTFLYALNK